MIRVLFVCTGNICRSPTAAAAFRQLLEEEGLAEKFSVDSAGTDSYHVGEKADARAIRAAAKNAVEMESHRARALTDDDFSHFDYIFAMDGGHLFELNERSPSPRRARLEMFLSALDDKDRIEVADPWYGGEDDFDDAFLLIQEGAKAQLARLRQEHKL